MSEIEELEELSALHDEEQCQHIARKAMLCAMSSMPRKLSEVEMHLILKVATDAARAAWKESKEAAIRRSA